MTTVERPDPLWLNVGCGEWGQRKDWWSLDFHRSPDGTPHGTFPDEVVGSDAWDDFENVDRSYWGHLLEHSPQEQVIEFMRGWQKAMKPGAEVCVVGPDVDRALDLYRAGELNRNDLWQRMEPGKRHDTWEGWLEYYEQELYLHSYYHRWNCNPERVHALLHHTGYQNVRVVDILDMELRSWPLVSTSHDQFCLMATAP